MAETEREILPGHLAIARRSGHGTYQYSIETIERALYEVAAAGGNSSAAARVLKAESDERVEQGMEPSETPPGRTIRYWLTGPFRNRYHEICSDQARTLEEILAAHGVSNALAMAEGEAEALKQTLAGLASANGLEASMILRNIAQAKVGAIQTSQLLRGRPTQINADASLEAIARELSGLGIVEVVEGTAEEVD